MAPVTQKRVVVTAFNPADPTATLACVDAPVPVPREGEVLVRVTARPVNPADVFSIMVRRCVRPRCAPHVRRALAHIDAPLRRQHLCACVRHSTAHQGVYPGFAPASLPATPGLEGAGVVEESNGTALAKGTRCVVFFNTRGGDGSWQEYVAVPATSCMPVPDSVSDEAAAQFLVNPVTVVGLLEELAVPPGEYVIQSAAGSTLGRQLITLAKKQGIKTINLVRRAEQAAELKAIGADEVLCTETDDVVARVTEITGGKLAWGAVDAVGGPLVARMSGAVRNCGTMLLYGAMSGLEFTGSIVDSLFRDVRIHGFWLNLYLGKLTPERKSAVFDAVVSWLADGSLVPHSGECFPLEKVVDAVKASQAPARNGKVLLK